MPRLLESRGDDEAHMILRLHVDLFVGELVLPKLLELLGTKRCLKLLFCSFKPYTGM